MSLQKLAAKQSFSDHWSVRQSSASRQPPHLERERAPRRAQQRAQRRQRRVHRSVGGRGRGYTLRRAGGAPRLTAVGAARADVTANTGAGEGERGDGGDAYGCCDNRKL